MRQDFTSLVYMVNGIAIRDARAEEKRLDNLLLEKWRKDYSKMVGFVRARMSLSFVRGNTLLLRGQRGNQRLMGRIPVWECSVWRTYCM